MAKNKTKLDKRLARKKRVRAKIFGTSARPRLSVYRSLNYIYAQVIDDNASKTLVSSNDVKMNGKDTKSQRAQKVGEKIAELCKQANIKEVVFDRNGCKYQGRIKTLAEACRAGGLQF